MPTPRIILTRHAQDMIDERGVAMSWVKQTIAQPDLVENDPERSGVVRAFRRIAERDNRMLRVVYVLPMTSFAF